MKHVCDHRTDFFCYYAKAVTVTKRNWNRFVCCYSWRNMTWGFRLVAWKKIHRGPVSCLAHQQQVSVNKLTVILAFTLHFFYTDLFSTLLISRELLGSRVVSVLDSGAEGPGFKSQLRRCRVTVWGRLSTPIVPLFAKQQNWQQPS